ncbi:hypothetical protein BZG02_10360 [Labilibaculum filiforme]|uniref:Uncharacterized protein n=1 Tax=Labilibaculum filiforme TaxID=1940526 RepID=A0A2N3HYL6_9BACT|nr:hypothetical protein [Labilibaculum filiforme]PKQ63155.1 hypothetical protein BZG02_10360 [Labilibaculum filiforme]
MITKNQVSVEIPEADLVAVMDAIQILDDKLLPHLKNLSADDRRVIPKMGDKTFAFVSKAYAHMQANPNLVPPYVAVDELQVDLEAVQSLKQVYGPIQQLANLLDDTMLLSGSEAYIGALAFYNYVKGAGKAGVPGTDMIYEDLSKRFPGNSKK